MSDVLIVEETYSSEEEVLIQEESIFLKISRWLLFLCVFLVPLWFLPFTLDILDFNKQVLLVFLLGLSLVSYLINIVVSGRVEYKKNPMYIPSIVVVLATLVGVLSSTGRYSSLFGIGNDHTTSLLSVFALAVMFFISIGTSNDNGKFLRKVVIISGALTLLFGSLQLIGIHVFSLFGVNGKVFNTVGSTNALTAFGAALLPLFIFNFGKFTKENAVMFVAKVMGLVSSVFLLIVINWFPLWLVAFVALLSQMVFTSIANPERNKMRLYSLPMLIIVAGIILTLIHVDFKSIKSNLPIEVSPTQSVSYSTGIKTIKSRPLGYGPERFGIAFDKFRSPEIANTILHQTRFTQGSSQMATVIVEGGILAILIFLFVIWKIGIVLIKHVRSRFAGDSNLATLWSVLFGFLMLWFMYPFNLTFSVLLVVITSLTFLTYGIYEENNTRIIDLESENYYSFVGSLAFILGIVAVIVGGYFTAIRFMANVNLAKASTDKDIDSAIVHLISSSNSYPQDIRGRMLLSQVVINKIAQDLQSGPKEGEDRATYVSRINNQIDFTSNVAEQATKTDPNDYETWMNRGLVHQNFIGLGKEDSGPFAISMYEEAIKLKPFNPVAYTRIGNTYLTMAERAQKIGGAGSAEIIDANLDKAEENYKKAIELYNNYGQALHNLGVVYERKGELASAIKQFEKLVVNNPNDPSNPLQLGLLYYRNGQKPNAISALEYAVRIFPDYSNARWYLSLFYEEQGSLDKALEQVKAIEKFNPDNELVKERITKLENGIRTVPPEKVLDQKPL